MAKSSVAAFEVQPGKGIAGEGGEEDGKDGGGDGDEQAVDEGAAHAAGVEEIRGGAGEVGGLLAFGAILGIGARAAIADKGIHIVADGKAGPSARGSRILQIGRNVSGFLRGRQRDVAHVRLAVNGFAEHGEELEGAGEFIHHRRVAQVRIGQLFAVRAMTGGAESGIRGGLLGGSEDGPPTGGVDVLNGAEGGDEQSNGWNDPDQEGEDHDEVNGKLAEEPVDAVAVHLVSSWAIKRLMLKYTKGMMTTTRMTATAVPRPTLKFLYISVYMRLAITSVP